MKYLDSKGKEHESLFSLIGCNLKSGINEMMKDNKKEITYDRAKINWKTGFVEFYDDEGNMVNRVKIDTDYYNKNTSECDD